MQIHVDPATRAVTFGPQPVKAPDPPAYLLGLDLGQAQDYTALVLAEWQRGGDAADMAAYGVRAIERFPLGTSYPTIVAHVGEVIRSLASQQPKPAGLTLVVDYTGVGRPVADMMRAAGYGDLGARLVLVTITGGDAISRGEQGEWRVPKRDLASAVLVLLQAGKLKISKELSLAKTLHDELTGFRVTINTRGHDSYGAGEDWRSAPHDDLVLAMALVCWYGERLGRRSVRLL